MARIAPPQFAECWIKDFDFLENSQWAFCGTHTVTSSVFKVSLSGDNQKISWLHQVHSGSVEVVRLSPNQQYVLSGDNCRTLVLARASNGAILATYGDISDPIKGIIWSQRSKVALICTLKELLVFKVSGVDEVSLRKIAQVNGEELGVETIHGMNVFWSNECQTSPNQKPFLIFGGKPGKNFRITLSWELDFSQRMNSNMQNWKQGMSPFGFEGNHSFMKYPVKNFPNFGDDMIAFEGLGLPKKLA